MSQVGGPARRGACEAVALDPPPADQVDSQLRDVEDLNNGTRAVLVIIVTSILIEVVLLAGPAFAVGARRRQRDLALVLATGGEARDVRRIMLAGSVVIGGLAAVGGAVLGVGVAAGVVPLVNRYIEGQFGPFDIPWLVLPAAMLLGTAAAVLAAWAPARQAARVDIVPALGGFPAPAPTGLRRRSVPLIGLLLVLGGSAVVLVRGTRQGGEYAVAVGTIVTVLGVVAVLPWLVGRLGRIAAWWPVPMRMAIRDAARHRSRTAPAVASVMGVVAGITALAIGGYSDEEQNRRTYVAEYAPGATADPAHGTVRPGGGVHRDASQPRSC